MWFSKKQATVETATYGAKHTAGRTCIEQMIDLRNTFRFSGVPVHETGYVFGDDESMVNGSAFPCSRIQKRHNTSSCHCVRSQTAKGCIALHHIQSHNNVADMVSKHWSFHSASDLLKPTFDTSGDAASLHADDSINCPNNCVIKIKQRRQNCKAQQQSITLCHVTLKERYPLFFQIPRCS